VERAMWKGILENEEDKKIEENFKQIDE